MSARRPYVTGLIFVVAVLAGVDGYYFYRSQSPTFWDDSSYLRGSLSLYDALTDHGIWGFATAFAHLFGTKAPLICVLPLPAYLLLGRGCDPRLIVSVGLLIVMSLYVFWIGECLWSPREGLLAVVVLQTMPLIYGLSRQFLVDYGLSAIVVMWMYYVMCYRPFGGSRSIIRLGVLLGAGMLMKVTFPLYVVAPTLAVAWFSRKDVSDVRAALRACLSAVGVLLIGGAVAGSWYLLNWKAILGFAVSAGFGKLSINYGSSDVFSVGVIWEYVAGITTVALSCYYALLLLSLTPIWAARTWPRILKPSRSVATLVLWTAVPLATTTLGVNKDPRYTAPVMAAIALGLARLMTDIFGGRRWLRWCVVPALAPSILAYAVASLPALGFLGVVGFGRWTLWSPHLAWYATVPGDAGAWGQRDVAEAVCRDVPHGQHSVRVFIPLQHQYLNNENFAYLSERVRCDVQVIGLPQDIREAKEVAAWIRAVKPTYVLVIPNVPDPELAPAFANVMKEQAEQIVTGPDSGFKLMYRGSLGRSGREILIYRWALSDT